MNTITYRKYIFKIIIPTFFVLSIVLTSLVWISQVLRLIHYIDKGLSFKIFFKITLLLVPSLLFMILPLVTVLSIIVVYHRLQCEQQLIIFRSVGLSNFHLAIPALYIAIFITLFAFYISAYLMPYSYNKLKDETSNFQKNISSITNAKVFNHISKTLTVYVDTKSFDGSMNHIILFDNKNPKQKTVFFAKHGRITNTNSKSMQFDLIQGVRHSYDNNGQLTRLYFDTISIFIDTKINYKQSRKKTSLELYLNEMFWPNNNLAIESQNMLIIDGHIRIIWPLFNFTFVFLTLSIFLRQAYNKKLYIREYLFIFTPILGVSYIHFTLQKISYQNPNYILLCYLNLFISIITSIWLNNKKSL